MYLGLSGGVRSSWYFVSAALQVVGSELQPFFFFWGGGKGHLQSPP